MDGGNSGSERLLGPARASPSPLYIGPNCSPVADANFSPASSLRNAWEGDCEDELLRGFEERRAACQRVPGYLAPPTESPPRFIVLDRFGTRARDGDLVAHPRGRRQVPGAIRP